MAIVLFIFIRCRSQHLDLSMDANRNILRLFIIRGCRLLVLLTVVMVMGGLAGTPFNGVVCIVADHDLFNDWCNDFVLL